VEQVRGHLADREALARAATGRDVIFHAAGLTAAVDEPEYLRANRDGTGALIEAAEHAGTARFVYISSMAAAGPARRGQPLQGDEPPAPVTAYGRSKLAGESLVRASRLAWTILRPPMVYGPRDREVLKVFQLARFGIAPVFGDGTQELSAIHASDLAGALVSVSTAEAAAGGTYYPCHPQVFTSTAFVRAVGAAAGTRVRILRIPLPVGRLALAATGALARAAGRATILNTDKANEFFQAAWTGDSARLTRDTGWHAEHDVTSGLADTWRWYRSARWL
jgi:nucleoside-diphosphate-sugar epimerase